MKDKTTGFEVGAADYVTKPFETAEVKARVHAHLQLKLLRDQERIYLQQIEEEKARSEQLLLNILPKSIAERLKEGETTIADSFNDVSVLFADISGFTRLSTQVPPDEIALLGSCTSPDEVVHSVRPTFHPSCPVCRHCSAAPAIEAWAVPPFGRVVSSLGRRAPLPPAR